VHRTLFISDLHLAEDRPATTNRFERFLAEVVPGADALYILGDLFEYWVGDDALLLPFESRVGSLLRECARSVPGYFMHGNRDFVVGTRFSEETGVRLLEDPTVVDLYGTRTLLMHGDTLCTGDSAYQAFRLRVRDPAWQSQALSRPLAERLAIAHGIRAGSEDAKGAKAEDIMDVTPEAVERAFADSGCRVLIHGHTHRPARHAHRVGAADCVRWVLPDWYESGGYVVASPAGFESLALA
jgi:UDP-2,3-diacylglucosamine hydrolase